MQSIYGYCTFISSSFMTCLVLTEYCCYFSSPPSFRITAFMYIQKAYDMSCIINHWLCMSRHGVLLPLEHQNYGMTFLWTDFLNFNVEIRVFIWLFSNMRTHLKYYFQKSFSLKLLVILNMQKATGLSDLSMNQEWCKKLLTWSSFQPLFALGVIL